MHFLEGMRQHPNGSASNLATIGVQGFLGGGGHGDRNNDFEEICLLTVPQGLSHVLECSGCEIQIIGH